jgi:multicomponent Na+:H+ antiporter subunit B
MNSLILQTTLRLIQPLLLMFSVYLLLFGHNAPGGGFAGGLMLASVFALHTIAFDEKAARAALHVSPRSLISVGLLTAVTSGMLSLTAGKPFMTSLWVKIPFGPLGSLEFGTPLLFDVGVYLVVSGVTLLIVFSLAEE